MKMILIFKTSVQTKSEALRLNPYIKDIVREGKWDFDLEDCDKIFRVETEMNVYDSLILLFNQEGFLCEELDD